MTCWLRKRNGRCKDEGTARMKRYDAILLLGVGLGENDMPTDEMHARVSAAAKAYREGRADRIVACGGVTPGHRISEADVMAALLERAGVSSECVIREDRSQITIENMKFAAQILGGAKGKRVLVVTSDYHLRRSVLTAMRAGFRAGGYAATLLHDARWKEKKNKELAYTIDMLFGWQDEGKQRPKWTYALFDWVFGKKK